MLGLVDGDNYNKPLGDTWDVALDEDNLEVGGTLPREDKAEEVLQDKAKLMDADILLEEHEKALQESLSVALSLQQGYSM